MNYDFCVSKVKNGLVVTFPQKVKVVDPATGTETVTTGTEEFAVFATPMDMIQYIASLYEVKLGKKGKRGRKKASDPRAKELRELLKQHNITLPRGRLSIVKLEEMLVANKIEFPPAAPVKEVEKDIEDEVEADDDEKVEPEEEEEVDESSFDKDEEEEEEVPKKPVRSASRRR